MKLYSLPNRGWDGCGMEETWRKWESIQNFDREKRRNYLWYLRV